MSTVGTILKRLREERGWDQSKLARRANVSASWISRVEAGIHERPSMALLQRVAVALDTSIGALTGIQAMESSRVGSVRLIPIANVRASAGGHSWTLTGDALPADDSWSVGKDLVGYVVSGECMEPEIMDGDLVAIDRAEIKPRDGEVVVAITEDGPVVKRYVERNGDPTLIDNKGGSYKPSIGTIVGVVREVRRRY